MKYIKTSKDFCLVYTKNKSSDSELIGYSDAEYAGSVEDRRSTSGYVFTYKNCLVTLNSGKQKKVSLSSTKEEYIALPTAVKEAIWLRPLLMKLNRNQEEVKIFCDNKSTICLTKNPEFHAGTKHIDIRNHFIKDKINEKLIKVEYAQSFFNYWPTIGSRLNDFYRK